MKGIAATKKASKGEEHRAVYAPPDDGGGYGYQYNDLPRSDCPECAGEGELRVRSKDTSPMTDDERKFFVGVKQTQHGIEYKFNEQMAALRELAKRIGFYEVEDDNKTNTVARMISELQSQGKIGQMPISPVTAWDSSLGAGDAYSSCLASALGTA